MTKEDKATLFVQHRFIQIQNALYKAKKDINTDIQKTINLNRFNYMEEKNK